MEERRQGFNDLCEQAALTQQMVADMHHRLFGNGQPGVIKEITDDISKLKGWQSKIIGFTAAVTFGLSILAIVVKYL